MTKFRDDWVKIVDFLIKAYFCLSPDLHVPECIVILGQLVIVIELGDFYQMTTVKCIHNVIMTLT